MKTIIYDSMNKQVWVEGSDEPSKRFENNHQARAYALKWALKNKGKVYDKYFGEYIPTKRKQELKKNISMKMGIPSQADMKKMLGL